ncbi:MAG: hypothetical protein NTU49_04880, partial [Gammaproteobacteria bacterium]|nr:hypothetical protein [Gammaproteobacteria bacterium]
KGQYSVARIDFGHAFSDLLRGSFIGGGRVDKTNFTRDFINREIVAGAHVTSSGVGSKSKLRRDYPGLILCPEMVAAMTEVATESHAALETALETAKASFLEVIAQQPADTEQILRSLEHIAGALDIAPPAKSNENTTETRLTAVFTAIKSYVLRNQQDMAHMAVRMQLQLDINTAISNGTYQETAVLQGLEGRFNDLNTSSNNTPFTWVRDDAM